MAEQQAAEDRVIKGYELRECIAVGGQGSIYRAYQPVIDREVAIKIIQADYANHPEFIRRFDAEAQLVARLEHLHIVPLYDFWREPNSAYLVMRWMRGGSLRSSLAQSGPWSLQAAARVLDQLASALAVAHRNLVVHRDLKPDNVLLDEENNVYLADFGIAKDIRLGDMPTERRDRMGSPAYMAPEQFLDHPVSPRTDMYSLGIVLYELITGQRPFESDSTIELAYHHTQQAVPPLQRFQQLLPVSLNAVIWRATAKNPEERYPDVLTFAREFHQFASEVETQPTLTAPSGGAKVSPTVVLHDLFEPQNPYKGLQAFQEGDAADFFGRGQFVERLLARLSEEPHFLALVGPSGSGKSSVLRAGLLPHLRQGALSGSRDWFYAQMLPGTSPLAELTTALLSLAPNAPPDLSQQLRCSEQALGDMVKQLLPTEHAECCLLIDQFEEIFTLVQDEDERQWFLSSLWRAITVEDSRIHVLITMRADFYDRPLLYPGFSELMRSGTEVVLPLQARELEHAVLGPAQRIHVHFESGLVSRIIADVSAQPGSLPLLQYALTELFERRSDYSLTNAAYDTIKGVSGALAQRAEEVYASLSPTAQAEAQKLMLRLVALGDEGTPTRKRALQAELLSGGTEMRAVMERFGRSRLVTFDHDRSSRAPTVELAHEALISVWSRLKDWIDANGELLRIQRRLSIAAGEWERAGKDRSFLASGARLAQFEMLGNRETIPLSAIELEYLGDSIHLRQLSVRRLRLIIAGLVGALLVVLALALFAFQQRAEAEVARAEADQQAKLSRSRELAALAANNLDQLDLSLLLSVEALKVADTYEARSSLLTALEAQPKIVAFLSDTDPVRAVALSPDGHVLASAGRGSRITLWNADTHERIGSPLVGHTDWINSLAFSPDGSLLASASSDGTVRLWNPATGSTIRTLGEGTNPLWSVVFSPDGQRLASASADGTIQLWDAQTGDPVLPPLVGHEDTVYSLAFSPDGRQLASASADDTVRLWDAATGEALHTFSDHANWVLAVAFSPDGQRLVSSGADEQLVISNAHTYETEARFDTGDTDWVRSLAFSPDGRVLLSSSQDGSIRVWDAATDRMLGDPLVGHSDAVWSIAFRPDSAQFASGGADGRTILWNLDAQPPLVVARIAAEEPVTSLTFAEDNSTLVYSSGNVTTAADQNTGLHLWSLADIAEQTLLRGQAGIITALASSQHRLASASASGTLFLWDLSKNQPTGVPFVQETTAISAVAISPDGQLIASGDQRGIVRLRSAANGSEIGDPLLGHEDAILSLAFSPDGQMLASGSRDTTIRLWALSDPRSAPHVLEVNTDAVSSVAFSPDGLLLASAGYDGTVRLWDLSSFQALGQPMTGHDQEVWSVAFSPDGRTLASAGQDGTIRLWDVATRQPLGKPLVGHSDWVTHLAFSRDALLASGSLDASLLLWDMKLDDWLTRACQLANRNLTQQEWARSFGDQPYHETCPTAPPTETP